MLNKTLIICFLYLGGILFAQDDPPLGFEFESSTQLGFYIFENVHINGVQIQEDDWVASFKCNQWESIPGECLELGPCVGARQWGECAENTSYPVCDVPAFGDDGSDLTDGYMTTGQVPLFKIYSVSLNQFFEATPSSYIPWQYLQSPVIESLDTFDENIEGCTDPYYEEFNPYAVIDDGSCGLSNNINMPSELTLNSIYPNPFNPSTTIHFSMKDYSKVDINIYNVKGQLIENLFSNTLNMGEYSVVWNPSSSIGSGIYFVKMITISGVLLQSVTYIR